MELVRGTLRLPPDGYAIDDRLREIAYGQWEGSTLAETQAADPGSFARRQADKWTVAAPGGESYAEVQVRVTDWYRQVTADTVAVAHGGTARALMVALGIETPASAADLFIEQGAVYVFGDGGLDEVSLTAARAALSSSCPGSSRASTSFPAPSKTWMAGTSPAMTRWSFDPSNRARYDSRR